MKISKKILGLLVVVFLVFGFSIGSVLLQSLTFFNTGGTNTANNVVKLPDTNIVDYELTPEQENALLNKGKIILGYDYNLVCNGCLAWKNFLEQVVSTNDFKEQMFLKEIVTNTNETLPKLTVTGFKISGGQVTLDKKTFKGENVTESNIVDTICDLMLQPPVQCALKEVR